MSSPFIQNVEENHIPPSPQDVDIEKGRPLDNNSGMSTSAAHYMDYFKRFNASKKEPNMSSPRILLKFLAISLLVTFSIAVAVGPRWHNMPCRDLQQHQEKLLDAEGPILPSEPTSFSDLLGSASPSALHRILSKYFPNRYKNGVFESEHRAMEVVHAGDAGLATSLVQLARRQDGSNTTDTPTTDSQEPTTPGTTLTPDPSDTTSVDPPDTTISEPTSNSSPQPTATANTEASSTSTESSRTPGSTTSNSSPESSSSNSPEVSSSVETSKKIMPTTISDTTAASTSSPPKTTTSTASSTQSHPATSTTKSSSTSRRVTTSAVVKTYTSTAPNGDVVYVTSTSLAVITPDATSTEESGSLQTDDSAAPRAVAHALPALVGVFLGGFLVV